MTPDVTMAGLIRAFCKDRGRNERANLKQCRRALEYAFEAPLNKMRAGEIFTPEAARRAASRCPLKYAPKTEGDARNLYMAVWEFAFELGIINVRPHKFCWRRRRTVKKVPRAYTVEQVAALFRAAENMRHWSYMRRAQGQAILALCYYTGCRISHILATKRDQMDWETGTVKIINSKSRIEQVFKLPMEAVEIIKDAADVASTHPRYEYLFPHPNPRRMLLTIKKRAGFPHGDHMFFHGLRRACATHIAAARGVRAASDHLGHADMAVTIRSYLDPRQINTASHCDALDTTVMTRDHRSD